MNTKIFMWNDWLCVFWLIILLPFYFVKDLILRLLSLRDPNCPLRNKDNPDLSIVRRIFLNIRKPISFLFDERNATIFLKQDNKGKDFAVRFCMYIKTHLFWMGCSYPYKDGRYNLKYAYINPSDWVIVWWTLKIFWFVLMNKEMDDVYCDDMGGEDLMIIIPVHGDECVSDIHRCIRVIFE